MFTSDAELNRAEVHASWRLRNRLHENRGANSFRREWFPQSNSHLPTNHGWRYLCETKGGIEQKYLQRIFKDVLQINPKKNQGGKGTGMGLYISKGITN